MNAYQPGQRVCGRNFIGPCAEFNGELGTIEEVVPAGVCHGTCAIPTPWTGYVVCWDVCGVISCRFEAGMLTLAENLAPVDEDSAKREADSIINRAKNGVPA
jgi:hypothetical protein